MPRQPSQASVPLPDERVFIQNALLNWYDHNRRELPWREDRDPYRVWVSEIMLQQTRVAAVLEHYRRFLEGFPSVRDLARAGETSVLATWSGLGYYRRARMMHAAAKKIVREHQGEFPTTAEELRSLPGIGRYTACAIASIAFGEPLAVVDGNVERVMIRFLGHALGDKAVWNAAQELIDESRPGDFNQAMMELGATICLPREPLCPACPVRPWCKAQGRLPGNGVKTRQIKKRVFYNLDLTRNGVRLVQRPRDVSLMPGFWELPEIKTSHDGAVWQSFRHSITTTDYSVEVVRRATRSGQRIPTQRLETLPLTGLTRKILRAAKVI